MAKKLLVKELFLLGVLTFCASHLFSIHIATDVPRRYTVDNGLPSEQVYRVFQDSEGFMWFCTDRGLSKFDGSEFTTLTVEHGLPHNVVLHAREDGRGAFYCMTLRGAFFVLDSGKVKDAPQHNRLTAGLVGNAILGYSCDPEKPIVHALDNGVFSYSIEGTDIVAEPISFVQNSQIYFRKDIGIWAFNKPYKGDNSYFYEDNGNELQVGINLDEMEWQRSAGGLNIPKCHWLKTGDSTYLLAIENGLYEVRPGSIRQVHRFDHVILCLKDDAHDQNKYYVGLKGGGLVHFSIGEGGLERVETAFDGYFISDVSHDLKKGLWVASLFNGVFYYPKFAGLETLGVWPNEIITCIEEFDGQLFVGTNSGYLRYLEDGVWKQAHKGFESVTSIVKVQGLLLVSFTNYNVFLDLESMRERIHRVGNISYLGLPHTDMLDSLIVCAGHRGIKIVNVMGEVIDKRSLTKSIEPPSKRTNELLCVNGKCIVCTIDGLRVFRLSGQADSLIYEGYALKGLSVRAASIYKRNAIIAGTSGQGIYLYDDGKVEELTYGGKRIYAIPNCMIMVNDSMLALGVNHGIMLLQLRKNEIVNMHTIDKNLGLQTNKTYSLQSYSKGGFLCSSGGSLVCLQQDEILSPIDAPLTLKRVTIDGVPNEQSGVVLESSFSELKLEYAALDFVKGAYLGYKYRINPENENWIYTNSSSISLTSLLPGNYVIEVTTTLSNTSERSSISVPVFVKAPFYQTLWFWLSAITTLIFGVLLYVRFRLKRAKIAQQLYRMEYSALNSQMNPHFLFNVLGSIQGFIISGHKTKANDFITQFAHLIRTNLNLSQVNEISMFDELEMLRNYLVLEQMRFEDGFEFVIDRGNLGQDVLRDLRIPRMLIQPIVENAILHGIRGLQKKGQIRIDISKEQDLRVEITDNGIGRVASRALNSRKRHKPKSVATSNIEKRIQLMKESGQQKVEMETQDLYDSEGVAIGTKVIFHFELIL